MTPDPASLDRLHDVITPAPAPFWPPAPAWYWLLGFVGIALLFLLAKALRHWQRNRYRREALALLKHSCQTPATLAELLKRVALSAWPRERVAALTGAQWLAFLDRSGRTPAFSQGPGALLEMAAYDSRIAASLNETQRRALHDVTRHWIKHHRVEDTL